MPILLKCAFQAFQNGYPFCLQNGYLFCFGKLMKINFKKWIYKFWFGIKPNSNFNSPIQNVNISFHNFGEVKTHFILFLSLPLFGSP